MVIPLYEMTNDKENCIWIPIPLIDDEDRVFEELARLAKQVLLIEYLDIVKVL
jgi:hypothetical protein